MRVFIGIGSNMGDRLYYMQEAVKLLQTKGPKITGMGKIYETEPVGYEDQDWFLNTVVAVETKLSPQKLLKVLQEVENELGRKREIRWGPRTVDLDLLLYDDKVINEPTLIIPHPRMQERAFVLLPLADIASNIVFPDGSKIIDVINNLPPSKKIFCTKNELLVE